MAQTLLRAEKIVKRFGAVTALRGVSFDLRAGEIHALCGENGAGKSTLIKTLCGIYPTGTYEGDLYLDESPLRLSSTTAADDAGIATIHQELALVPEMDVAENIFLGREPLRRGFVDRLEMQARARELLGRFGVNLDPRARVGDLGIGRQQLVEIVKALSRRSRILVLDEPTAALSETETRALLATLRELRADGIACIYISHKLDEVFAIADRITVLRDGASIATLNAADTGKNEIVKLMVGRELGGQFPPRPIAAPAAERAQRPPVLAIDKLCAEPPVGSNMVLTDISFSVRAGEVLGLGGLMGAGRTELLMHLFGAWGRRTGGQVLLNGEPFPRPSPSAAIARGMVLVSEDRKRYGLVAGADIDFNLSLSSLHRISPRTFVDRSSEARRNDEMAKRLHIRAANLETLVGNLSGGNQQKVVIGKALLTGPKIVFLDEPTRGIDVGAKYEIYQLINQLTDDGLAVVVVSSELPELMGMSDRIVMLREGNVGGEFTREEATPELLLSAAIGEQAQLV